MVQVIETGNPQGKLSEMLGMSLGQGIGNGLNTFFANRSLESVLHDKALEGQPVSKKLEAMRSALSPYGEKGQELFNQRLQIDQQEMNEAQTLKLEKQQKVKGKALQKYLSGKELSEEESELFTPKEWVDMYKAKNPNPKGGLTGQAIPPEISNEISNVLKNSQGMNSDELALAFDEKNIPPIYTNKYIENRREQGKQNIEEFKGNREYHSKRSDPVVQDAQNVLKNYPIKKGLFDQQRRDIASGNVEGFPQFMADKLNLEIYRNPEASRFKNISKNRFIEGLSELGGAGARPNQFIEQQLTQAQPAIGRSRLANETVLDLEEFIEDMKVQRSKYIEQLADEDVEKYGYVKSNIAPRADKMMQSYAEKRQDEMAYDIRKRTEDEMDNAAFTREIVAKQVAPDTPLTIRAARVLMLKNNYDEKKATDEARRLGYKIPLDSTYSRGK